MPSYAEENGSDMHRGRFPVFFLAAEADSVASNTMGNLISEKKTIQRNKRLQFPA